MSENALATGPRSLLRAVADFNEAFNRRDVDAVMKLMTDDVAFENTSGGRFEGQEAVRGVLGRAFELMTAGAFRTNDMFAAEDRCVVLWTYMFNRDDPEQGQIQGVDVFRLRDGLVAEKFSYVKSEDFVRKLGLQLEG